MRLSGLLYAFSLLDGIQPTGALELLLKKLDISLESLYYNRMRITKTSPFSGKVNTMELPITLQQIKRWERGECIQNVFPELTPGQREFILTGITDEEWAEHIGDD